MPERRKTHKKFIMSEKITFQSNIRLKTYRLKPEKNDKLPISPSATSFETS